jgi:hypothetical protein
MKKIVYLAIISSVMMGCSKKIPYTLTMAQKLQGKEMRIWFYSDINRDCKLTFRDKDTSDLDVIKRGVIKETITGSIDDFNVITNTVGGAEKIASVSELSIRFDKQDDRLLPFAIASDSRFYLKTVDATQQVNVLVPAGYYLQWNTFYNCQQMVFVDVHFEQQVITRHFVKLKSPNGVEKLYEASSKIMLYVKKKDVRKINHTSKTASGYKPGK